MGHCKKSLLVVNNRNGWMVATSDLAPLMTEALRHFWTEDKAAKGRSTLSTVIFWLRTKICEIIWSPNLKILFWFWIWGLICMEPPPDGEDISVQILDLFQWYLARGENCYWWSRKVFNNSKRKRVFTGKIYKIHLFYNNWGSSAERLVGFPWVGFIHPCQTKLRWFDSVKLRMLYNFSVFRKCQ